LRLKAHHYFSNPIVINHIAFITVLSFSVLQAVGQTDCVLQKDQDGIKVFTCHAGDSPFKIIKAQFTLNASIAELEKFILDAENYVTWQYNTYESNVIQIINSREIIYYAAIRAPWPVSDRDMVAHIKIIKQKENEGVVIETRGMPGLIPEKDGRVRVPSSMATWTVKELGVNKLSVEYFITIDPGGAVPAWMVNMVSAEAPYYSFKNLKAKLHH